MRHVKWSMTHLIIVSWNYIQEKSGLTMYEMLFYKEETTKEDIMSIHQ